MPGNPSEDVSTLKGFDLVLSITEPAINNQLELLYNTPIKPVPLPQPGTAQPNPTYLINHALELHPPQMEKGGLTYKKNPDGSVKYSQGGVIGWIAAPTIKIKQRSKLAATVSLKFIQNPIPEADGTHKDSIYRRWEAPEGEDAYWDETVVNGWSFSWDADLSSRDIQSMQEVASVPPDVERTLKGYVDNNNFTVSSIFCLMQSVKITNTLSARDQYGNEVSSGPFLTDFLKSLIGWFDYELKANGVTPTPNPQGITKIPKNPFVLGYGISQKLPPSPGIPLFVPRRFVYSTSDGSDSDYGALNFCMITQNDREIDTFHDGNAGNFVPSLAKQVNLNYADRNNLEADGIMAISNGAFYNQYIVPFFLSAADSINFSDDAQNSNPGCTLSKRNESVTQQGNRYWKSMDWSLDVPAHNTMRRGLAIQERSFYWGRSEFSIEWTSDPAPAGPHGNDVQRRGYLSVWSRAEAHVKRQTNTRGGMSQTWSDMDHTNVKVGVRRVYNVDTTLDGQWNLSPNAERSWVPRNVPDGDGKPVVELTGQSEPPADMQTGVYAWGYAENYFGVFGGSGYDDHLRELVNWGTADIGRLEDKLNGACQQLQFKIILPAGNVFMFKGLNVDSNGNWLCPVTYQSMTQGGTFQPA